MKNVREQVEEAFRSTPHKLSLRFAILSVMYERGIPWDKLSIEGWRVRDTRVWDSIIESEWMYPYGLYVQNGRIFKNNKYGKRPKKPKEVIQIAYSD